MRGHPRRKQRKPRAKGKQQIRRCSGQVRPVPKAAQNIVDQTEGRSQQKQPPRLHKLYRCR